MPLLYLGGGLGAALGAILMFAYAHAILIPAAAVAARQGYVLEARATAAEAQLSETKRQLAAGRKALDGYAKLLADEQAETQKADATHAVELAELLKQVVACEAGAADVDVLNRRRRSRMPER